MPDAMFLTVREAAARYRVSTWLCYQNAASGKWSHLRVGGAIRFYADELDACLRRQRAPGGAAAAAEPAGAA